MTINTAAEMAYRIIRGPGRDQLTLQDLRLLEMAIDGKISGPELEQSFSEIFRDLDTIEPATPVVSVVEDLPEPTRRPQPDSRPVCVIKPGEVRVDAEPETGRDRQDLEDILTSLALIHPANRRLVARVAVYVLELQSCGKIEQSARLSDVLDGIGAVEESLGTVRGRALDLKTEKFDQFLEETGETDELAERDQLLKDHAEAAHFRGVVARNPGRYKPDGVAVELTPSVGKDLDTFDKSAVWDRKLTKRENWSNIKNFGRSQYRAMCAEFR